jgi:phosphotransferase system  glucose/maltose/N-acetylglucosamine-specific IIC component
MGTMVVRLFLLLVIWTALSAGITWVLTIYGDLENWITPFVALVVAGAAVSAATVCGLHYLERRYL